MLLSIMVIRFLALGSNLKTLLLPSEHDVHNIWSILSLQIRGSYAFYYMLKGIP